MDGSSFLHRSSTFVSVCLETLPYLCYLLLKRFNASSAYYQIDRFPWMKLQSRLDGVGMRVVALLLHRTECFELNPRFE